MLILQPIMIYFGIQLSYILTYFLGYGFAKIKVHDKTKVQGMFKFSLVIVLLIAIIRILGRYYIDGTDLYDRYIALISQTSIGTFVFMSVFYFGLKLPGIQRLYSSCLVNFVSIITYEIYLVHYLFLRSPWALSHYFGNRFIADIFVVLLSVFLAFFVNKIVAKISRR